jgi:hypothetical protein
MSTDVRTDVLQMNRGNNMLITIIWHNLYLSIIPEMYNLYKCSIELPVQNIG